MLQNILDSILNAYTKYCIGPIILTAIFTIVLFAPYNSSGNFNLITVFFGHTAIISGLLLSVFAHNVFNGNKHCKELFAIALISLVMSINTILFYKTHSFLNVFAAVSAIFSTFAFFTMFKKMIVKMQG